MGTEVAVPVIFRLGIPSSAWSAIMPKHPWSCSAPWRAAVPLVGAEVSPWPPAAEWGAAVALELGCTWGTLTYCGDGARFTCVDNGRAQDGVPVCPDMMCQKEHAGGMVLAMGSPLLTAASLSRSGCQNAGKQPCTAFL